MHTKKFFAVIGILAPLVSTFAIALDIYVPAVPHLISLLNTNATTLQLTLSLFMLSVGIGQLFFGPLADHFGRRKIALASILTFTLGSFLCGLSPNVYYLIAFRVIQAIGAAGMMVTAFAVSRDVFSGVSSGKSFSYLNASISVSPLFAPVVGGYLIYWIGWRSTFFFMTLFGLICFLQIAFRLQETRPEKVHFNWGIFKRYLEIFCTLEFFIYTFCAASALAGFFTFFSVSPYIIINLLHVKVQHFGYYFAILGVVFFVGSVFGAKVIPKIGIFKTVFTGSISVILGGVIMYSWYKVFGLSMSGFLVPMIIMGLGGALMMGASTGGALEPFGKKAGSAAALLGATQFILAFVVGTTTLKWKVVSTIPLSVVFMVLGCICFCLLIVLYIKNKKTQRLL